MSMKAIEIISDNPCEFDKYAYKFKCKSEGIGVLYDGNEYISNDNVKSEVLQAQFSSVWSKPSVNICVEDMEEMFGKCNYCENEEAHICKFDEVCDTISEYKDQIMMVQLENSQIKAHKVANFEGFFILKKTS